MSIKIIEEKFNLELAVVNFCAVPQRKDKIIIDHASYLVLRVEHLFIPSGENSYRCDTLAVTIYVKEV